MSSSSGHLAVARQFLPRAALAATVAVVLSACSESASQAPHGGPPPVSVAPAVQREVREFDEFTGRLEATESVDLRPRVSGYIEQVHFREGQEVRRGDLLFSIDAAPFRAELAKAEAQLAAARTQADLATTEQARAERLLAAQAISQAEYDQQGAGLRNADANARAAEAAVAAARLNVDYAAVRAPISGRISRANVTAGNLVSSDAVLTTIVSLAKVYAYFEASEQTYLKYVAQVREGTRQGSRGTNSPVLLGLANEDGYPHQGTIDFVDNRLNPQTGSIRARAVFDNADRRYTPGLFARIKLIGNGATAAVLTPDRAIGTDQSKKFVLVIGPENVAQFREVSLGPVLDGMRVVHAGVKPGDLVVVNGLQRVRPGMAVTPQKLEVDARGMPIEPPAAVPGAAGAAGGQPGAGKGAEPKKGEKNEKAAVAVPAAANG